MNFEGQTFKGVSGSAPAPAASAPGLNGAASSRRRSGVQAVTRRSLRKEAIDGP